MDSEHILTLCRSYPKHEGSKVLQLLIEHVNEWFQSLVIDHSLGQKIDPLTAGLIIHIPFSQELADYQTIREVRKELMRLINYKAELISAGVEVPFDLEEEISQLSEYLKECTHPGFKLRKFNDEAMRAYKRQNIAVRRFLERLRRDGYHAEAEIIRQNLKLGLSSCYKGER